MLDNKKTATETKSAYKIAHELGVTPQAVYKRLTPELLNQLSDHIVKPGDNKIRFYPEGERIVKELFNHVVEPVVQPSIEPVQQPLLNQYDSEIVELLKKNIDILQAQLEIKDRQIEAKDRQIDDLSSALVLSQQTAAAAQALHAGTMNHLTISEEKKPGILSRLFRKSKGEL